ncbi:nucleoside-diphosphate-sugar epimerase [Promicromonospora sp. AC04]|uniref:NmrA family NAD(P)-binding protein n=1 Tax=Promicromonospora sp. AC04 TaxID=2135723 RepID=UPI000D3B165C|nr:NmrA family NAD(P)-binding protein [Promicromonospora sp. AC04]PUB27672.1 nucleoside-diphosphate-sugar epimerase [Promicromonospora sp. AC04]
MMSNKTIALMGASGHLGALIAQELMAMPDVQLRLLVRPGSRAKVADLEARGAQVVEGDINSGDTAALSAFTEGAMTVISAVQGGPETIIEGQRAVLRAAREAGVRRFIPSTFSLDMFTVNPGQIVTADMRRHFAQIADDERGGVEVTHVMIGGFLDKDVLFGFIDVIDPKAKTARVWGEGESPMDYTTYADTARYTAAVAVDERPVPRVFAALGDSLNFADMVLAYEEASGTTLTVRRMGSLEDLDAQIAQLQEGGQANFLQYLPLMYYRAQLKGQGRLDPVMNDRYPHITPTTVRQYVQAEGL